MSASLPEYEPTAQGLIEACHDLANVIGGDNYFQQVIDGAKVQRDYIGRGAIGDSNLTFAVRRQRNTETDEITDVVFTLEETTRNRISKLPPDLIDEMLSAVEEEEDEGYSDLPGFPGFRDEALFLEDTNEYQFRLGEKVIELSRSQIYTVDEALIIEAPVAQGVPIFDEVVAEHLVTSVVRDEETGLSVVEYVTPDSEVAQLDQEDDIFAALMRSITSEADKVAGTVAVVVGSLTMLLAHERRS